MFSPPASPSAASVEPSPRPVLAAVVDEYPLISVSNAVTDPREPLSARDATFSSSLKKGTMIETVGVIAWTSKPDVSPCLVRLVFIHHEFLIAWEPIQECGD